MYKPQNLLSMALRKIVDSPEYRQYKPQLVAAHRLLARGAGGREDKLVAGLSEREGGRTNM
eukprot:1725841-Rhodomonas_salina.2